MSPTWTSDPPERPPIGTGGWLRVALRGPVLAVLLFGGLAVLLLVRLVERPVHGIHRPWTPWIVQGVCRLTFPLLGIGYAVQGARMKTPGAVVANHASWLDIFALNARKRVYFVSKAEVARWPAIGWLARSVGTVFITRSAREAKSQQALFEARLHAGHKLLFFPEGTSSDGRRVLPFKSTLFAAFFALELRDEMFIQPVSVIWHAPDGADARFYGWWGDMGFGPHLVQVLAQGRQGRVEVIYHAAVPVTDFPDRKALALHCETEVRIGMDRALGRATIV